ncbi:hypothetical protein COS55_02195 [Candidatus Shapirobacteria bacterium CG03_land_8_20_14_0_80_40_19]|uniref:Uncharacterized protein n=1 Tax=Candidatus Shapirobacteria bacterium CG03_land_8_20_14_0_80_40_19 TaxID=1974880 RepID=A0A2M7BE55_9BACT|nr:MAG: hypothetical protein COS55_02195 [Candidatus Shapirobacteria bacterium CG03_land_8_20_14_0_80_40_19]
MKKRCSVDDLIAQALKYLADKNYVFCPSTYPQCADKKNLFDTLLMNKNKVYFNVVFISFCTSVLYFF